MGGKKAGGETQQTQQTQTYTMSPEERNMINLQYGQAQAADPYLRQVQQSGLSLANMLLQGREDLPGYLRGLSQGLSEPMIQDISQRALQDLYPQFQRQGILDSGTAASIAGRTAGDIRRSAYEYNIGNRLNLLNLALSGQAQIQSPVMANAANLLGALRGTGATSTIGSSSSSSWSQAPIYERISGWMDIGGKAARGVGGFMGIKKQAEGG